MDKKYKIVMVFIGIMLLGCFAISGHSQNIPVNMNMPVINYNYGNYLAYASEDNNYRIYLDERHIDRFDGISMTMDKPTPKSTYIFNQFYLNLHSDNKDLSYWENNIFPFFRFLIPDLAGTNYFKCEIGIRPESTAITIEFQKWIWTGSSWGSLTQKDLETISYDTYNITDNTNSLEFGIHCRIELDGSNTILYYQDDFYTNGTLANSFNDDIYTFTSLTRDNIYFEQASLLHLYVPSNAWTGYRCIYMDYQDYPTNFIDIPPFNDEIPFIEPDKKIPKTYWTYLAYTLVIDYTANVSMKETILFFDNNLTLDYSYPFSFIKGQEYTAKFWYNTEAFGGNWGLFDWARWLLNGLLFGLQFLLYLLVVGLSFIFGWLFVVLLIPFLYNVVVYWLFFALVYVGLWATIGLLYLLVIVINLTEWLIVWFVQDALPYLMDILIFLLSWIFALFIYVLTLGQANLDSLVLMIQQFLNSVADFFFQGITFIVIYFPELLLYTLYYFMLIGFCYMKLSYVKARGYVNRANQLQSSLEVYILPIKYGNSIIVKLKQILIGWW